MSSSSNDPNPPPSPHDNGKRRPMELQTTSSSSQIRKENRLPTECNDPPGSSAPTPGTEGSQSATHNSDSDRRRPLDTAAAKDHQANEVTSSKRGKSLDFKQQARVREIPPLPPSRTASSGSESSEPSAGEIHPGGGRRGPKINVESMKEVNPFRQYEEQIRTAIMNGDKRGRVVNEGEILEQERKRLRKAGWGIADTKTNIGRWEKDLEAYKQRVRDYYYDLDHEADRCRRRAQQHSDQMSTHGDSNALSYINPPVESENGGSEEEPVTDGRPPDDTLAQEDKGADESPPYDDLAEQELEELTPDYDVDLLPAHSEQNQPVHQHVEDARSASGGRRMSKTMKKKLSGLSLSGMFKKKDVQE